MNYLLFFNVLKLDLIAHILVICFRKTVEWKIHKSFSTLAQKLTSKPMHASLKSLTKCHLNLSKNVT